ncbi:uncharacterized protein N7482_004367 [Penicillium canariense]|uniref:Uncharacterized protein n=1 Tax=Penicillium canariense TaxID=189055 RepID=A0A9W9LQG4_9EURO|nr:uncharacterized protein N7482_004367 [Penicillium canariense]KAJ5168773.1 hypothetical protein N7482_004367 [Penicillium canariense]
MPAPDSADQGLRGKSYKLLEAEKSVKDIIYGFVVFSYPDLAFRLPPRTHTRCQSCPGIWVIGPTGPISRAPLIWLWHWPVIMMPSLHYQALLAGAAIATVLLFLIAQFTRSHGHGGMAMFHGHLPPIPEYAVSDKPKLHEAGSEHLEPEFRATSAASQTKSVPSAMPSKQWDDAWDDKNLWPEWSRPSPTATSRSSG